MCSSDPTISEFARSSLWKKREKKLYVKKSDQLFQRFKDQVRVLKSRSALVSVSGSSFRILISRSDQTLILRARDLHIQLHHSQKIEISRRIAYRSAYSFSVQVLQKKGKGQLVQPAAWRISQQQSARFAVGQIDPVKRRAASS
jgi:hypothetical protein